LNLPSLRENPSLSASGAIAPGADRSRLLKEALLRVIDALSAAEQEELVTGFLDELLATRLRREVSESVGADRAAGHVTALISASPDVYVRALGSRLGFDLVVCTRLVERSDGGKASRVAGRNCKGPEKLAALQRHLGDTPVAWETSRAYSDHISDLPLLERVGTPVAVHPERRLRALARARGWTTLG